MRKSGTLLIPSVSLLSLTLSLDTFRSLNTATCFHYIRISEADNVPLKTDFMEMISLQGKANFFESRVSAYAKSGVNQSVGSSSDHSAVKKGFTLDEDF